MLPRLRQWLEERTGLPSAVQRFLDEDIPASAGWHQVLGSVALFAFLIQAATGILLALNYGPTPAEAHASVRYIMTGLTGGPMIRGLHHWGASAMIVVVVLHMLQVFIWGAYKKPRETTWIVGCVLLLMTLAFGLTGYLLPWDNRAYWGTTVTTQIAGLAPVVGSYVKRLLGAEGDVIGNITFARFYTAHVVLLPVATLALAALHIYLVRRHGVTPVPGDEARPAKKFYPSQVFKDTVATFAYVMAIVLLANFAQLGLGRMADPTDTSYIPRPEWYFLFLFELLKVFEGPLEVVGAVILPNLAIVALILVPFLDRGQMVRVRQRTAAIALVVFGAIGWAGLTQRAIATTPANTEDPMAGLSPPPEWILMPPEQLAGVGYFYRERCDSCHVLGRSAGGPDLAKAPSIQSPEWLQEHFGEHAPDLRPIERRALVQLATRRDDRSLDVWKERPDSGIAGAMIYDARQCAFCHTLNGSGNKQAPVLNGLAGRRSREWVEGHFARPAEFSPGSQMPAYRFSPEELEAITSYLLEIPK
jgi:ubiquinol-cytochrome c reductase cytochrome b subunit